MSQDPPIVGPTHPKLDTICALDTINATKLMGKSFSGYICNVSQNTALCSTQQRLVKSNFQLCQRQ